MRVAAASGALSASQLPVLQALASRWNYFESIKTEFQLTGRRGKGHRFMS